MLLLLNIFLQHEEKRLQKKLYQSITKNTKLQYLPIILYEIERKRSCYQNNSKTQSLGTIPELKINKLHDEFHVRN